MSLKLPDRSSRVTRSVTPRKGPQPFTATELQQIGSEITAQWFRPIEAKRLTLMEIDPWNVHAYWNIAAAEVAAARARLPGQGRGAALQLRFTDISPRLDGAAPHEQFDIEVQPDSNNWYVSLWRDARHYSAELGLRAADGAFVALARSNEVVTPRAAPSPEFDFREMEVRAPHPVTSGHAPAERADNDIPVNDFLLRDLFPCRLDPQDDYPLVTAAEPTDLVADDETPGRGAAFAAPEPAGDFPYIALAEIAPWHERALHTRSEVVGEAALALSPLPPLPPVAAGTIALTDVALAPQPLPIPPASFPGEADEKVGVGETASPDAPPAGANVAGQPAVPLEAFLANTMFSPGHGSFPVNATAHVLIAGQATPATPLTLFGKPVALQEDGSFDVRLPLPRGPELAALLHFLRGRDGDRSKH